MNELEKTEKSFHMTPQQFRKYGYELVDWIAAYYERVESLPVLPRVQPGQVRAQLPPDPPSHGEDFQHVLQDVESIILPAITHWQSPNFFAFFPANASGPAILGELLSAGLGVQGMLWATSPACTELETHILDWLVDMLALPQRFKSRGSGGGVIQDSASSACLCALIAARERATRLRSNQHGCSGGLVAYTSSEAHSCVEKAVRIAGIGSDNLRRIPVDDRFAMRPELLAQQIREDLSCGYTPFFCCATVGTTSCNGLDLLAEIGRICAPHQLWLHVDAAMSGTAALCPEFRYIHHGLDLADSYAFNPHKWLFTNFDCNCFFVADKAALTNALGILPEYLRNTASASGTVTDYRDWQIPLGRRFRALKLWLVIRHYGVEGLRHHIRRHVELAQQFAAWVEADERFTLARPPPLNLVCFRYRSGDEDNLALLDALNRSGKLYLTHTRLQGRLTLRFCVGQTHTELSHVQNAWSSIQDMARLLRQGLLQ